MYRHIVSMHIQHATRSISLTYIYKYKLALSIICCTPQEGEPRSRQMPAASVWKASTWLALSGSHCHADMSCTRSASQRCVAMVHLADARYAAKLTMFSHLFRI